MSNLGSMFWVNSMNRLFLSGMIMQWVYFRILFISGTRNGQTADEADDEEDSSIEHFHFTFFLKPLFRIVHGYWLWLHKMKVLSRYLYQDSVISTRHYNYLLVSNRIEYLRVGTASSTQYNILQFLHLIHVTVSATQISHLSHPKLHCTIHPLSSIVAATLRKHSIRIEWHKRRMSMSSRKSTYFLR